MIITDLLAEDFRKYEYLHLEALPERGVLALVGGNESGKSSIGDAIAFALFGHSLTLGAEDSGKLVRWGSQAASVTLSFRQRGRHYRLARRVDPGSTQSVSLWSVDESRTLADTQPEVARVLKTILGYDYPAFVRAFYWSQQVSTDSKADTESLRAMAGVRGYLLLEQQLQQEHQQEAGALEQVQAEMQALRQNRDTLALDRDLLPVLLDIRETLEDRQRGSNSLLRSIDLSVRSYPEGHARFHALLRRLKWLSHLASVGIGAFLLLFVAGMLLSWLPGMFTGLGLEPETLVRLGRMLLWCGMVAALMASGLLFWGWHAEQKRLPPLRDQSLRFSASLANAVRQLGSSIAEALGEPTEHYLVRRNVLMPQAQAATLDEQVRERLRQFDGLPERVRLFEADPAAVGPQVQALKDDLEHHNTALDGFVRVLDQDVAHEQALVEQYQGLNQGLTDKETEAGRHDHAMRVQDKALELVRRASEHSAARFNSIVHKRCQTLLADFTQAHYD
ncbi:MAG: AAA family ATPase, partial [Thiothrix sp.]|nr:AAA family ATPase [Thiothrix sp.]